MTAFTQSDEAGSGEICQFRDEGGVQRVHRVDLYSDYEPEASHQTCGA